jgi:Trehalose and maltose hydrolases (possible phosphorylases)
MIKYQEHQCDKSIILDRIPERFNEGPFWGNGTVGCMLYLDGGMLNFVFDHVLLWETRDATEGRLVAPFNILREQRHRYGGQWKIDPDEDALVAPLFPKEKGPCSTRLPGLPLKIKLDKEVTAFKSETDIEKAVTDIGLVDSDGRNTNVKVYVHSCRNILDITFSGEAAHTMEPFMPGWDYSLPSLTVLKDWGYREAVHRWKGSFRHMLQYFGEGKVAVMTLLADMAEDRVNYITSLNIGDSEKADGLMEYNSGIILKHISYKENSLAEHFESWTDFWKKSDIRIQDDRLQQAFYLEQYKLFCNARNNSTPITLQGIWNDDKTLPPWLGDLHNDLNVQSCYWVAFKTGHADLVYPYIKHYYDAISHFRHRARLLTGIDDAIQVPTLMNLNGYGAGSEWNFWNTLLGPELYTAVDFCWYFEFTQDKRVLEEIVYPYLNGVANLYKGIAEKDDNGLLYIPMTQSPEFFEDDKLVIGEDSTFVLSCLRYVLGKLILYSGITGKDTDKNEWMAFLNNLAKEPVSKNGYMIMHQKELNYSHRHFSHLFPIFPLGTLNRKNAETDKFMQLCLDNVRKYGFTGYAAFSFPYLAILSARCGRGNMARMLLEIYCMCFRSRNGFTVNGDAYHTGVLADSGESAGGAPESFTLEAGLIVPAALAEMIVHRIDKTVFVLPAMPDDWKWCEGKGLTLEGGHEVDVVMEDYGLKEFIIRPGMDETIDVRCDKTKGKYTILNGDKDTILSGKEGQSLTIKLIKGVVVRIIRVN